VKKTQKKHPLYANDHANAVMVLINHVLQIYTGCQGQVSIYGRSSYLSVLRETIAAGPENLT